MVVLTTLDDWVRPLSPDVAGLYRCTQTACLATDDQTLADLHLQQTSRHSSGLDAIAVNARELSFPAASHVLVNMESSSHFAGNPNFRALRGLYVSYKREPEANDVQMSYVMHTEHQFRMPPLPFERKVGLVAWMASNCIDWRDGYVRNLIHYLGEDSVHRYGPCLQNKNTASDLPQCAGLSDQRDESECVMHHYKFYLAFENTREDAFYVTEKFYLPLAMGAVPVYLGTKTVTEVAPSGSPNSYIYATDFPSAEALAGFLQRVGNDPALYHTYLQWKQEPFSPGFAQAIEMSLPASICRVCSKGASVRVAKQADILRSLFAEVRLSSVPATVGARNDHVRVVLASSSSRSWGGGGRHVATRSTMLADIEAAMPAATVVVQSPLKSPSDVLNATILTEFLSIPTPLAEHVLSVPSLAEIVWVTLGHLAAVSEAERSGTDNWTVLVLEQTVDSPTAWAHTVHQSGITLTAAASDGHADSSSSTADVVVILRPEQRTGYGSAPNRQRGGLVADSIRLEPLAALHMRHPCAVVAAVLVSNRAALAFSTRGPVHQIDDLPLLSARMQQSLNMYYAEPKQR